jgi:hypothetical protein
VIAIKQVLRTLDRQDPRIAKIEEFFKPGDALANGVYFPSPK